MIMPLASSRSRMKTISTFISLCFLLQFTSITYHNLHSVQPIHDYPNLLERSSLTPSYDDGGRSAYGYRRPGRFQPIRHTSHNCSIHSRRVAVERAVPNLIIIGAQKSGTSTIQVILSKHRNALKPIKSFEVHFFDWEIGMAKNDNLPLNDSSLVCKFREQYWQKYDSSVIQKWSVAFEKTPSYMNYPSIASAIDVICPWKPKLLSILRNPVDRAWSQYQMDFGRGPLLVSFRSVVNKEIRSLLQNGILEKAMTIEEFERSRGSNPFRFPRNMTLELYAERVRQYSGERARGLLYRGLYAPQLLFWIRKFAPEDRLMVLQFESFVDAENKGDKTIADQVLRFAGLAPTHLNGNESRRKDYANNTVWQNERLYKPMPARVRQYLTMFYQPFNDFLADLLGDEWNGVWTETRS